MYCSAGTCLLTHSSPLRVFCPLTLAQICPMNNLGELWRSPRLFTRSRDRTLSHALSHRSGVVICRCTRRLIDSTMSRRSDAQAPRTLSLTAAGASTLSATRWPSPEERSAYWRGAAQEQRPKATPRFFQQAAVPNCGGSRAPAGTGAWSARSRLPGGARRSASPPALEARPDCDESFDLPPPSPELPEKRCPTRIK